MTKSNIAPLVDELGDTRARIAALERREACEWKRFQLETFRLALVKPYLKYGLLWFGHRTSASNPL
jgi:hypothetical protein